MLPLARNPANLYKSENHVGLRGRPEENRTAFCSGGDDVELMTKRTLQTGIVLITAGALVLGPSSTRGANVGFLQEPTRPSPEPGVLILAHKSKSGRKAPPPIRLTHEELHKTGVPKGWTFRVPPGDPDQGRKLFIELECHQCHSVRGEKIPPIERGPEDVGPDLTGMGSQHPPEYFAESILNPNRIIVTEKGYAGEDGLSTMPSYADVLTLQDLIDLVAYLSSLREEGVHDH